MVNVPPQKSQWESAGSLGDHCIIFFALLRAKTLAAGKDVDAGADGSGLGADEVAAGRPSR